MTLDLNALISIHLKSNHFRKRNKTSHFILRYEISIPARSLQGKRFRENSSLRCNPLVPFDLQFAVRYICCSYESEQPVTIADLTYPMDTIRHKKTLRQYLLRAIPCI